MLNVLVQTAARHDLAYVALAFCVCIGAGLATLWLEGRSRQEQGVLGLVWLLLRSLAAGSGVWAGNVIALLAYRPPVAAELSGPPVGLALVGAVLIAIPAMLARRRPAKAAELIVATVMTSISLSVVHYAVLAAWRVEGRVVWLLAWQFAGVLALAGLVGLSWLVGGDQERPFRRAARVGLIVLGVAALHLVSIAGLHVTPDVAAPALGAWSRWGLAAWTAGVCLAFVFAGSSLALFQALAERKAFRQLRTATDAMPTALAYFDSEDRLVVWNATFEMVMGAARAGVRRGMSYAEMDAAMPLGERTFFPAEGGRAPRKRATAEFRAPGGTWVRVDNVPTADGGLLSLGIDITQLKRSEAALAEALSRAEAASRAKSEFLAIISHEIRTPMNGVLGMAQALGRAELEPADREKLAVIQTAGEALLTLLNDMLDLSKIEAGRIELEEGVLDVGKVAGAVRDTFSGLAAARGVALELQIAPAALGWRRGDPVRVRQILLNLVSNAVKFTERGAVRVHVGDDGGQLVMTVSDTGPGIAADQLERVFDAFVQADASTTRRHGGSGLGLSICRELARLMGGGIQVDSVLGEGAAFTVRLPLPAVEPPVSAATASPVPGPSVPGEVRLLAADDNPMNRLVLRSLLDQLGLEAKLVEDGEQAVQAWEGGPWDLILMDVQMPVMDGPSAARLIRERELQTRRPRTPILALTANAMDHQAEEYRLAGMDGVIAKPIHLADLDAAIASALERR